MTDSDYMKEAFAEAFTGMRNNEGGPFGAVVVLNGAIIGRGRNRVTATNDPTAHAEVTAIRQACENTGMYHLTDAVIYTVCEPCPMCLAAIYWAKIQAVYYCLNSNDAKKVGFDDEFIYEELNKTPEQRTVKMKKVCIDNARQLFTEWDQKKDKLMY